MTPKPMTRSEATAEAERLLDEANALCEEHGIPLAVAMAKTNTRNVVWWVDRETAGQGIATAIGAVRALGNVGRSFAVFEGPTESDADAKGSGQ